MLVGTTKCFKFALVFVNSAERKKVFTKDHPGAGGVSLRRPQDARPAFSFALPLFRVGLELNHAEFKQLASQTKGDVGLFEVTLHRTVARTEAEEVEIGETEKDNDQFSEKGFTSDLSATAYLHSCTEEDALKGVAAAVPQPTLFHLYRVIVNHASADYLSLRACSGLEGAYVIDLLPEHALPCVDDDEFASLADDVATQAAHRPASSSEGALPSMLRLGTTLTKGLHMSP